ncbi:MAG: hypothetical protein AAF548_17460 [Actinomycetota bacterium]
MTTQHIEVGTAADTTITIRRLAATDAHVQGLVVDGDEALEVNGIRDTRIVLWADTSPDEVEIRTSAAGPVRFWNVWRDGDLIQSWQGEAHIDIDDEGEDLELRCHDGHGAGPDLEVRIMFDRAWTQPSED